MSSLCTSTREGERERERESQRGKKLTREMKKSALKVFCCCAASSGTGIFNQLESRMNLIVAWPTARRALGFFSLSLSGWRWGARNKNSSRYEDFLCRPR